MTVCRLSYQFKLLILKLTLTTVAACTSRTTLVTVLVAFGPKAGTISGWSAKGVGETSSFISGSVVLPASTIASSTTIP